MNHIKIKLSSLLIITSYAWGLTQAKYDTFVFRNGAFARKDPGTIFETRNYGIGFKVVVSNNTFDMLTGQLIKPSIKIGGVDLSMTGYIQLAFERKTASVIAESQQILEALHKCADYTVNTADAVAINDLVFKESAFLDKRLQKAKYQIQLIIYNNESGEYVGIQTHEDAAKIKKIIENFKGNPTAWRDNKSLILDEIRHKNLLNNTPYNAGWDTKVRNNLYNKDLFEIIRLCNSNGSSKVEENIKKAQEIADQYKRSKYKTSEQHTRYIRLFKICQNASRDNKLKANEAGTQRGEPRVEVLTSAVVRDAEVNTDTTVYRGLEKVLTSEEFLANQFLENVAEGIKKIQSDAILCPEYASDDSRTISSLQALKESLESPIFVTKNYELTEDGKILLLELGIDEKGLSQCYGNQLQQVVHEEFVVAVNQAAMMRSQYHNAQIAELSANVVTFSTVGSTYLKSGHVLQALHTADFCKSLLDCGYALGESIVHGALHPIETANKLTEAIEQAGHHLSKIICHLGLDNKSIIEKYFPHLNPEDKKAMLEFWEFPFPQDIELVREMAISELLGGVTHKLLGPYVASFFKGAKNRVISMWRIIKKGGDKATATLAEGVPVQVRIAEKATKSLIEKARGYAHSLAQYEKLKALLRVEEFTSIVNVTEHGIKRLIGRGFTANEVKDIITSPTLIKIQSDGSKAYIKEIFNRYNLIILNEQKKEVITALKGIDKKALENLGKNYGWK